MAETFLDRLKKERDELKAKYNGLCHFLKAENFKQLSNVNQMLLWNQEKHMHEYLYILEVRLELLSNTGQHSEHDLVSFGNYVLNQRKNKEEKSDNDAFINDADLKNWQAQKGK